MVIVSAFMGALVDTLRYCMHAQKAGPGNLLRHLAFSVTAINHQRGVWVVTARMGLISLHSMGWDEHETR